MNRLQLLALKRELGAKRIFVHPKPDQVWDHRTVLIIQMQPNECIEVSKLITSPQDIKRFVSMFRTVFTDVNCPSVEGWEEI